VGYTGIQTFIRMGYIGYLWQKRKQMLPKKPSSKKHLRNVKEKRLVLLGSV